MKLNDIMSKNPHGYARRKSNYSTNPLVLSYIDGYVTDMRIDNMIQNMDEYPMSAYELIDYLQGDDYVECDKYGKIEF